MYAQPVDSFRIETQISICILIFKYLHKIRQNEKFRVILRILVQNLTFWRNLHIFQDFFHNFELFAMVLPKHAIRP